MLRPVDANNQPPIKNSQQPPTRNIPTQQQITSNLEQDTDRGGLSLNRRIEHKRVGWQFLT